MALPEEEKRPAVAPEPPAARPPRTTGAMHEDVPVWSDPCCSCEAEPYWTEEADEASEPGGK